MPNVTAREWQFDGLVGPTHNYAGLAFGNMASQTNRGAISNPRAAALQGLAKMRFVRDMGIPQAFIPPYYRPSITQLQRLGFNGNLACILDAAEGLPGVLASVYSASGMWTANLATVTPSSDTADGRVHFTPANLVSHFHRAIEADSAKKLLDRIFHNNKFFTVHNYLTPTGSLGDEGAANHMRVIDSFGSAGKYVFVHGDASIVTNLTKRFPARQSRQASEAVARLHGLDAASTLFLSQSPEAIDAGVFHHDVIGMNCAERMLIHRSAFDKANGLERFCGSVPGMRLRWIELEELSLSAAVQTYFFNSQLLKLEGGDFVLVAPAETREHAPAASLVDILGAEGMIDRVEYIDVRESMRNGGGPACLRLRVVLTEAEASAIHPGVILTDAKFAALNQWVATHYRDRLSPDDFRDPALVGELDLAFAALEPIIGMPGLYAAERDALATARD